MVLAVIVSLCIFVPLVSACVDMLQAEFRGDKQA